jgi:hypothetical protein
MNTTVTRSNCARVSRISPRTANATAKLSRHKGRVKASSLSISQPFTTLRGRRVYGELTSHHEEVTLYLTADRPGWFNIPEKPATWT